MTLRETPAAALMRAAQDAPDRPTPRIPRRRIQAYFDLPTLDAIDRLRLSSIPQHSQPEWFRLAVLEKIARDK